MDEDLKFDIVCLNSELFDSEPHISCRVLYFDYPLAELKR